MAWQPFVPVDGYWIFATAQLDTGLIARHHDALFPPVSAPPLSVLALATCFLLSEEQRKAASTDPWASACSWRMNSSLRRSFAYTDEAGNACEAQVIYRERGWLMSEATKSPPGSATSAPRMSRMVLSDTVAS